MDYMQQPGDWTLEKKAVGIFPLQSLPLPASFSFIESNREIVKIKGQGPVSFTVLQAEDFIG